jgi:polysaccharide biosynthesis/export protein
MRERNKTLISMIQLLASLVIAATLCAAQENKAPSGSAGSTATASDNTTAAGGSSANKPFNDRSPRYRIEPGDSFDVSFELSPEFNQTVSVQPDGFVTLRGIGDLKVAGQTVPELTQTLHVAYSKILNNPPVTVILKDFEKPYFVADGQVARPGKYEMHGQTTLIQAIAMAGGFQSSAKHSQVLLFRRIDDQWTEAKLINVKKMQKSGNLSEDPFLHPGDMLFVPKTTLAKIDRFIPNLSVGSYMPIALP